MAARTISRRREVFYLKSKRLYLKALSRNKFNSFLMAEFMNLYIQRTVRLKMFDKFPSF